MSTRRKGKGFRVVPDGAPGERRRSANGSTTRAPSLRAPDAHANALERLFEAAALLPLAEAHELAVREGRPAVPGVPSVVSLRWKVKRARLALTPAMRAEATRALVALDAFLRAMAREVSVLGTFADALPVAARFAVLAASLVREENPDSTLDLAGALSAAFWQTQTERDDATLAATPPGHRAKVATKRGDQRTDGTGTGTVERSTTADYAERHQRAKESATQARQERIALRDQMKGRPSTPTTSRTLEARVEELIARDARAAEQGAKLLADRPVIDVAESTVPAGPASLPPEPMPALVAVAAPPPTPTVASSTTPGSPPASSPVERIVYSLPRPGEPQRPAWWGPQNAASPSAEPDAFASLRHLPDHERGAQGFASLVGPWKDRAQLARDQGRPYTGPRSIPGFVARWLQATGRGGTLDHMTRVLGFFVEPDTNERTN